MKITKVYIDGFNLYNGIIRANRLHWLDLFSFAVRLNRGEPVAGVVYCTAMVSSEASDPEKAQRQFAYHQAIQAFCPNVEILKGIFTTHPKNQPVAGCKNSPMCTTRVAVRNEKGSDVNLASRLLHDAHVGALDRAIVVSGDSDLVERIRLVVKEVGKIVWVRNPRDRESAELMAVANDYSRIRPAVLLDSQLPDPVVVNGKKFHKPARWSSARPLAAKTDVLGVACPASGCQKMIKTCRYI